MTKKKNKNMYVVALALFLGAVGYLVYSGFSENSIYFLNVSEALAMPAGEVQSARLFGTVKGSDISYGEDGVSVRFLLEDKDSPDLTVWVTYTGLIPDLFQPGAEVIVEGSFSTDSTDTNSTGTAPPLFTAHTLMTKCPSKYEKANRE